MLGMDMKGRSQLLGASLLLVASLLAGCTGTSSPISQKKCEYGVALGEECVNPMTCSGDGPSEPNQSGCLPEFMCQANRCVPRLACAGIDDHKTCGAGRCFSGKFADNSAQFACQNPASCDPSSPDPFLCIPIDYCSAEGICMKPKKPCNPDGCARGVCSASGECDNREVCYSNAHCKEEFLCSKQNKCVLKEGDSACGGKCENGPEGGICNQFLQKCVNDGDSSCAVSGHCHSLGNHRCLKGFHWDASLQRCTENKCNEDSDCKSVGGGVCDPTAKTCVEPSPCESDEQCSSQLAPHTGDVAVKEGVEHLRVCVASPDGESGGHSARVRQCVYLDEQCAVSCPGKQTCTRKDDKIQCASTGEVCTETSDCTAPEICRKEVGSGKFRCGVADPSVTCVSNPSAPTSFETLASLLKPRNEASLIACGDGVVQSFAIPATYHEGKRLKITITIDKLDRGKGTPVVELKVPDGTGGSESVELLKDTDFPVKQGVNGTWVYTAPSVSDTVPITLEVSFKGSRVASGVHYTLKVEPIDTNSDKLCRENAKKLVALGRDKVKMSGKIKLLGSGEESFKLGKICADAGEPGISTDLYRFTLREKKWVNILLSEQSQKANLWMAIQKGCEAQVTEVNRCIIGKNGGGGFESFSDFLEPGDYTVIVSAKSKGEVGSYLLEYQEKEPNCDPAKNSCTDGTASYCDVKTNQVQSETCSSRCDVASGACVDKVALSCDAAEFVDLTKKKRVEKFFDFASQNGTDLENREVQHGECGSVTRKNTLGYNFFLRVKVPANQWLAASVATSKDASSHGNDYSLYFVDHCGVSFCLADSDEPKVGAKEGAFYLNDSSEPKEVIVVVDSADPSDPLSRGGQYDKVDVVLEAFEKGGENVGPCDINLPKKCVDNRFIKQCTNSGKWEIVATCDPRVGCQNGTSSMPDAICNPTPGDSCPANPESDTTVPNITNTTFKHETFLDKTESYRIEGELCSHIGQFEELGRDALYKVKAANDGDKVVVQVKSDVCIALWRTTCVGSSISCEKDNVINSGKIRDFDGNYLTTLEFDAPTAGNYYVVVQRCSVHDQNDSNYQTEFEITGTVSAPDADCKTDLSFAKCEAGKLKVCSKNQILIDAGCPCDSGETTCRSDMIKGRTCYDPITISRENNGVQINKGEVFVPAAKASQINHLHYTGVQGACFFANETQEYESIFRMEVKAGELVEFWAELPALSSSVHLENVRPYFMTTCGDASTCTGYSDFNEFSSGPKAYYYAKESGTIYLVLDGIGQNSDPLNLKWKVTSGKVCAPGETSCDAGNRSQIQQCNNDGTAFVSSAPISCSTSASVVELSCGEKSHACEISDYTDPKLNPALCDDGERLELVSDVDYFIDFKKLSSNSTLPLVGGNCGSKSLSETGLHDLFFSIPNQVDGKAQVIEIEAEAVPGTGKETDSEGKVARVHTQLIRNISNKCDTTGCVAFGDSLKHNKGQVGDIARIRFNPLKNDKNYVLRVASNALVRLRIHRYTPECHLGEATCKSNTLYSCNKDYMWEKLRDCTCQDATRCQDPKGDYYEDAIPLAIPVNKKGESLPHDFHNAPPVSRKTYLSEYKPSVGIQNSWGSCEWLTPNHGPEKYYKVELQKGDLIDVTMSSPEGDQYEGPTLYLLGPSGQGEEPTCLANDSAYQYAPGNQNDQGVDVPKRRFTYLAADTGTYYIVVDYSTMYLFSTVSFDLQVNQLSGVISVPLEAVSPAPLNGERLSTGSGVLNPDGAVCNGTPAVAESGPERVYQLKIPANQQLDIKLEATSAEDYALYLVSDLENLRGEGVCRGFADNLFVTDNSSTPETLSYMNNTTETETLYLVVDTKSSPVPTGTYTLTFALQ